MKFQRKRRFQKLFVLRNVMMSMFILPRIQDVSTLIKQGKRSQRKSGLA